MLTLKVSCSSLTSPVSEQNSANCNNPTPDDSTLQNDTHSKGCLLLVEDYKPNILVATTLLEDLGYEVDVAVNGEEAIGKILPHWQKYILVLMDIQMPIMDGFEAISYIRQEEKEKNLPHLPVIAMTAHALRGDKERCIAAGMDSYVSKPFDPMHLEMILEQFKRHQ